METTIPHVVRAGKDVVQVKRLEKKTTNVILKTPW